MTVRHLFPDVAPVLNLDFANTKRLDPRITFTRASTGTYVDEFGIIKTAAANQARFDHDGSGNSLGLLIEESRTNYTPDGTGFTVISGNGRTAPSNGTFSSTSVANPTGSAGSTLFTTAAVSGTSIQITGADYSQGNVGNAMSMFIKPNGITKIFLSTYTTAGNQGAYFDLTGTGSVVGVVNNLPTSNYFITAHPNSWYRIGVRSSASARVDYRCAIWEYDGSSNPQWTSVTGDGTSGFYIWGWQNELGGSAFWTSVIPTSGSTVTRSADVASMTGTGFSSWWNASTGTFQANFRAKLSGTRPVLSVDDNTANNRIELYTSTSSQKFTVTTSGAAQADITAGTASSTAINSQSAVYGNNDFSTSLNGAAAVTDTSGTVPVVTQLRIGANQAGNTTAVPIARLTYYDRRLTDAQLQALTL